MDLRKLKTQFDYSQISQRYSEDFGKLSENIPIFDELIKLLKQRKFQEKEIVDLGSGPGTVVDYFCKNGLKNITAVDFVPEFCSIIRAKYKKEKTVKVVYQDMLEFARKQLSQTIGCYVANFSLIHIPDEEIDELFIHLVRSLMWNGLFLASFYEGKYKGMEDEPYTQISESPMITVDKLEAYMNYFQKDELQVRLEKAGLKIRRLEVIKPQLKPGEFSASSIWVLGEKY